MKAPAVVSGGRQVTVSVKTRVPHPLVGMSPACLAGICTHLTLKVLANLAQLGRVELEPLRVPNVFALHGLIDLQDLRPEGDRWGDLWCITEAHLAVLGELRGGLRHDE